MNKDEYLESSIKEALVYGEDKIKVNNTSLIKAKNRLRMEKGREEVIMRNRNKGFTLGMKKTAAVICSLAIMATASVTLIKPVRAFANEVKAMVYDVIKGDDGKYTIVKVSPPQSKTSEKDIKAPSLEETSSKETEMPKALKGGYQYEHEAIYCYNVNTKVSVAIGKLDTEKAKIKFKEADGWKNGMSYDYKKGSSTIIVNVCNIETPFLLNSKFEEVKADNEKQLTIGGINVIYAEYPDARYPIVNNVEDRTQPPISVKTAHTLKWQHNGKYYTLFDFTNDMNLDNLKDAAESIIDSIK